MSLITRFFDRLEDYIRGFLSHRPILYGLIAGAGIVLFWRGIWHTADLLVFIYANWLPEYGVSFEGLLWWDGPLSIAVGAGILLLSGVFVSEFIGNEIIISGLRGEKKLTEKTENELRTEVAAIAEIHDTVMELKQSLLKKPGRTPRKPSR